MLLSSRPLQRFGAATPNATIRAAVFSPSSVSPHIAMFGNQWRRKFCDGASGSGYEGLSDSDVFVSGDSHVGGVRAANYALRHGYGGGTFNPKEAQQQIFRPWRLPYPPGPPPKSADHRHWIFNVSQPSPDRERFKILSYNILADYLALDHKSNLYYHIPNYILAWEWRKRRLFFEFGLWSPDILCLQEVDKFCDIEGELAARGYAGIWKMRTGNAVDGCAIFWRTNRFHLRHEEHIEFSKLGLRDNVAQICVLESKMRCLAEYSTSPSSYIQPTGANQVIVCNTHVLYNPKRGEIKLGQVRVLLDRAFAVSRAWNDAPVIVCGDFNSLPKSPLYKFIATQKLTLLGLTRDQISGQYSATLQPQYSSHYTSYRPQTFGHYANESTFDVNAIKLGKVDTFRHSNCENFPGSTPGICVEESVAHTDKEAKQNIEKNQINALEDPCSERYKLHSIENNFTGIETSFHCNKDDFSSMDSSENSAERDGCPTWSDRDSNISCKVDSEKVLDETPVISGNLIKDLASSENKQSSELSGLQENSDPTFFKDLLGLEDAHQTMRDFNSSNFDLQQDFSSAFNGAVVNEERRFYNPYCWSPIEAEIACGKKKCTVVEHSLKLRSVYTDVEDYTGTKDSSREPQVTTYNQQFMGTVDYIWCSENLHTLKVLDTIPKHILQRTPGFPTQKWGSDHLALVCELAFSKGSQNKSIMRATGLMKSWQREVEQRQ